MANYLQIQVDLLGDQNRDTAVFAIDFRTQRHKSE